MSDAEFQLSRIGVSNGVWTAVLSLPTAPADPPVIDAVHRGRKLTSVKVSDAGAPGCFRLSFEIPGGILNDGTEAILIVDAGEETVLGAITVGVDCPDTNELVDEVALLRAELDLLKRAFRRHCDAN